MLTPSAVANAKPKEKAYKLADGGGLFLLVNPNGRRWWRWKYRRPDSGKENLLSLGVYPDVSLRQARERRDEARKLLADGIDPGVQREAQKQAGAERAANSFEAVAREWLEVKSGAWVEDHARKIRGWLEQHVFPHIGGTPIAELEAPEILSMLRRLVARGTLNTAGRVRETVGAVFRYGIATGRCVRNPAADLRDALPTPTKAHFASVTDPVAIGELLRAIDGYQGSPVTLAALKLAPMLFQRPGELRAAEWSEIDFDAAEWRIPAARQKLRKALKENPRTPDHVVPLPPQALLILRELHALTGRGRYLFPGVRTPTRPLSENTLNAALRRLGYSTEQMTGHGFRHMASTRLNELGWNPDAIERQLAHRDRNAVRASYNWAQYAEERTRMMAAWGDYLDALRTGANVVAIRKTA